MKLVHSTSSTTLHVSQAHSETHRDRVKRMSPKNAELHTALEAPIDGWRRRLEP